MKKTSVVLVFVVLLISFLIVSCGSSGPAATPTPDLTIGRDLVQNRCNTCHGLSSITNAKYDREGWTQVVDRMIANGATLNDQQKEDVINFLAATYHN